MYTFTAVCAFMAIIATVYGACNCDKPSTAQDAYCAADWAMNVVVDLVNDTDSSDTIYTVAPITTYKFPAGRDLPLPPVHIVTAKGNDSCGVQLMLARNYILLGTFDSQDRLSISSCLALPLQAGVPLSNGTPLFIDIPLETRTDLILKKFNCASASTTARPSRTTTHK